MLEIAVKDLRKEELKLSNVDPEEDEKTTPKGSKKKVEIEKVPTNESFQSDTQLGILGSKIDKVQPVKSIFVESKRDLDKIVEDQERKRKALIDGFLYNLFTRKDNAKQSEQLSDIASSFRKKQ